MIVERVDVQARLAPLRFVLICARAANACPAIRIKRKIRAGSRTSPKPEPQRKLDALRLIRAATSVQIKLPLLRKSNTIAHRLIASARGIDQLLRASR